MMHSILFVVAFALPTALTTTDEAVVGRTPVDPTLLDIDAGVVPVTLEQCIYLSERNSLPLRSSALDVQIAKAQVGSAIGVFDTVAFFNGDYEKNISPTGSGLEQGTFDSTPQVTVVGILSETWSIATGFRGLLVNGASYQADLQYVKSFRSQGTFGNFNPAYNTSVGFSLTQPLLRGYGTTVNKAEILNRRNVMQGVAEGLEENRLLTARDVIVAYWAFYFSREDLETKRFAVEQGERLVSINQKKLEVGEAKRIDVIEAEADLATRQQEMIAAENEIGRSEDQLKRLILPFEQSKEWDIQLVPPDWRVAAEVSLERRPELRRLRELLKNRDLDIVVAENDLLPRFDLVGSLRFNQLAPSKGQALNYDDDLYSVGGGVRFEMPLANRTARYDLAAVRLQKTQALIDYKNSENQIIQEVRDAVRNVTNRAKEIERAKEATRLALERWTAEQERQRVGYSTTFQVRDAQEAWREAADAELRSLFDYQVALAELELAQGTLLERHGILPAPTPELDDRAGLFY